MTADLISDIHVAGRWRPAHSGECDDVVDPTTVFDDVTPDMRVAREEIFGPVLSVLGYDDLDHAVTLANDSPYGLCGAVFGRDEERAFAVAGGLGVEFGLEGIDEYLTLTSIHRPGRRVS